MSEQLSLLDWRPPADILPFPLHRSHGATARVARSIIDLDTPKRTGRLNNLRSQVRKRLSAFIGGDRADEAADAYIRMIRIHFGYLSLPKQKESEAVILSLTGERIDALPHGGGAGGASALGQGAKLLAGLGGAHDPSEYDAAHAREGGAA